MTRTMPVQPAPDYRCIGGPYRSQIRLEMEALAKAVAELGGIPHKIVVKPVGKRGDTVSYLWRERPAIATGHELRDSQRHADYRTRKRRITA